MTQQQNNEERDIYGLYADFERHLRARIDVLTARIEHNHTPSLEGMLVQKQHLLMQLEFFTCFNKFQLPVIKYLLERGYELRKDAYFESHAPEFIKQFDHKQVRGRVTPGGVMIYLDPGAGVVIKNAFSEVHPNTMRLDFPSANINPALRRFEDRASNKDIDDMYINEIIELYKPRRSLN